MRRSLLLGFASLFTTFATNAETLKINGSTTVNLPVAEAAEILRAEQKMEIQVDTQGGSAGGISMSWRRPRPSRYELQTGKC